MSQIEPEKECKQRKSFELSLPFKRWQQPVANWTQEIQTKFSQLNLVRVKQTQKVTKYCSKMLVQ